MLRDRESAASSDQLSAILLVRYAYNIFCARSLLESVSLSILLLYSAFD